ncbi:MAG: AbrB/MazE/SpoVT family DNA-binding domain-containing protein [Phycisphaerales bacterium]
MMRHVTVRKVGGSLGATLPKEVVDRFHVEAGDKLVVVATPDGILLTPYDADTQLAVASAAKAARKYRHALRQLAK